VSVSRTVFIKGARLDYRNFRTKVLFAVIAIAGTFLAVGGQSVPNNLMAHTSITGKANTHAAMLNDSLMTSLQDVLDKLFCAVPGNLALGLIASASGQLNQREGQNRRED
jgi:hypothetical protein